MGLVVFMYLICSLRTNVVFFCIFLFLDIAFFLLSGAYWKAAEGNMEAFHKLEIVSDNEMAFICYIERIVNVLTLM